MADETLRIGVTAELADFKRAMAELPDIGAKEARDMVAGIQRELRRAEIAAKQTTAKMGSSFDDLSRVGERALGKIGGAAGELGDVVFDVIAPLGQVSAALGLVGGGAAAVAGTAAAVVALGNAGVQSLADLRALGVEVDRQASESLDAYADATSDLGRAWDELVVTLSAEVAPELTATVQALTRVLEQTAGWSLALRDLARDAVFFSSLGMSEVLSDYVDSAGAAAVQTQQLGNTLGFAEDWFFAFADGASTAAPAVEETTRAMQALRPEVDALAEAQAQAFLAQLDQERQLIQLYADEGQFFIEARQNEEEWRLTQLDYIEQVRSAQALSVADQVEREADEAEEKKAKALATANALAGISTSLASSLIADQVAIEKSYLDRLYAQAEADGEFTEAEKATILEQFRQTQRYQAAQAIINAAAAGVGFAASLSYLTPLVSIPIALAAAGGLLASSLTTIYSAPLPTFPTGMTPDHHDVQIQRGEGIASRRAMSMPGMEEMLTAANEGIMPRSGGSASVQVSLDPRLRRLTITTDRRPGKRADRGR